MSQKILLIFLDGDEQRFPLTKDRVTIGRDKGCDIVLQNGAISRKHAAIVNKFGSIYVENISSTGKILKGGDPVEYVEMNDGEDFVIGPYTLHWRSEEALEPQAAKPGPEASDKFSDEVAPSDEAGGKTAVHEMAEAGEVAPPPAEDGQPQLAIENQGASPGEGGGFEVVASDDKTQVSPNLVKPILKIVKGEVSGREIRLDNGLSWIVGRSAKCHIQIDNQKMSRQHFKIIKIGNAFRVEDMGSANGTRLNGVAVTDAPLQPFDTLQAGPVEVQFLMSNGSVQPGGNNLQIEKTSVSLMDFQEEGQAGGHDKTMFAPPAVYTGAQPLNDPLAASIGANATKVGVPPGGTANPGTNAAARAPLTPKEKLKEKVDQAVIWFNAQPKQKKILYGSAAAVILLCLLMSAMPGKKDVNVAVTPPDGRTPASLDKANAAQSPDISPEFSVLPAEKQAEIRDLYVKAEKAQAAKDWKTAFESARQILAYVKRYKNTVEIMDEAQTYLNEDSIGNISKSLNSVKDAQRENEEQLTLLIKSGEKALDQSRWDDAAEAFSKALNLDPNNERATKGFAAATAKNKEAFVSVPSVQLAPDPDLEKKQIERDEIDGLKKQFQEARAKMNEGKFRESLPILKNLDAKLGDRIQEYQSGKRAPASIRDECTSESMALESRVREGIDTIKTQLRAEYQTQLSDAEQFESNRQYVQAREIYDRILKTEPAFDEVKESLNKLYVKIIAEARTLYQEASIYEAVGDLDNAVEGFQKTSDLLYNVNQSTAIEYRKRATKKLRRLQR